MSVSAFPAYSGEAINVDEEWKRRAQARCEKALLSAISCPDRLSLMREWTRLSDGHLSLADVGVALTDEERSRLPEFGLQIWNTSLTLASDYTGLPRTVAEAFELDSSDRRLVSTGVPDAALLRWSPHLEYRSDTQKSAIRALLTMPAGSSMMVSMPTGTGKSLLFQMAPSLWQEPQQGACAVVITPTIALALDHERTLRLIPHLANSRAITSNLTHSEREEVLNAFRRGEVPVLLMSPEQAFGAARSALLEAAQHSSAKLPGLAGRLTSFFVDEAHIIESWGRSFRPDFQRLPGFIEELRKHNSDLRTVLLSATLGRSSRDQLRNAYGRGEWLEIHAGVPRYEFDIAAQCFESAEERDQALFACIRHAPRPAIIYTNLVQHARSVYDALFADGHRRIALFTGEVSDGATRQSIINDWAGENLDLVVATSAFGMGVDKANVRAVIHASIPEGPSRYYQEIGRSARDGHQGSAVCLWHEDRSGENDLKHAVSLASGSWISREKAEKRWRAIVEWGKLNGGLKWVGTKRQMTVNLDAVREGLDGESTDYNRLWNMSVLNLLQRSGHLQITGVIPSTADVPTWQVDVLDDILLTDGQEHELLWDSIEVWRSREKDEALQQFRGFHRILLNKTSSCVLTSIYRLIDPEGAMAPDCGRCWKCKANDQRPPRTVSSLGLDQIWPQQLGECAYLPVGITMVIPNDAKLANGFETLLLALSHIGIEQFIVPDSLADASATALAPGSSKFGLVLSQSDVLKKDWVLANLPTALLLRRDDKNIEKLWRRLKTEAGRCPLQSFVVVAANDSRAEGRPLQQVASKQAPLAQDALQTLIPTQG